MRRSQTREVVHDMRQPLATIAVLVGAAEADGGLSPEVRRCLQQIKDQARELGELCRRILDSSSDHRIVALGELVADVVARAEAAYGCHIGVAASDARVFGDEVNLRRAVGNLLENACRAADGGAVRVRVREVGPEVRVEVTDAGPGFGAGPRGTTSLGLAIVDGIVRQHSGRVEIEPSELGGAMVTMVIPMAGHSHPARGSSRPTGAGAPTLVVDVRETEQRCPA